MTPSEVKGRLDQIRSLRNEIKAREEQLEELATQATHITSVLSHAKAIGGDKTSQPESFAVNSYELRMDLEEKVQDLYLRTEEAMQMLECLPDPLLRGILIDIHINGYSMTKMERKYNYSYRQIYNLKWIGYRKIATNFK